MNRRFCLAAIILLSLLTSCACSNINADKSAKTEEIVFDDGYNRVADANEVIIDDGDFKASEDGDDWTSNNSRETIKTAFDNSKITTRFDRYGNKIETRTFDNNPLLWLVRMQTTSKGEKKVYVYGQNGDVKNLPENMLDKMLTATASDLAAAAGISLEGGSRPSETYVQSSRPLQPMPSYKFPVRTPMPRAASETVETAAPPEPVETPKLPAEQPSPPDTETPDEKVPLTDLN